MKKKKKTFSLPSIVYIVFREIQSKNRILLEDFNPLFLNVLPIKASVASGCELFFILLNKNRKSGNTKILLVVCKWKKLWTQYSEGVDFIMAVLLLLLKFSEKRKPILRVIIAPFLFFRQNKIFIYKRTRSFECAKWKHLKNVSFIFFKLFLNFRIKFLTILKPEWENIKMNSSSCNEGKKIFFFLPLIIFERHFTVFLCFPSLLLKGKQTLCNNKKIKSIGKLRY